MIKVPATAAGIPAIQALIAEGINVNVTLLFALDAYEAVAEAYQSGLEAFAARGGDPGRVESVASFFISRIDAAVDALIEARLRTSDNSFEQGLLKGLIGRVAIANEPCNLGGELFRWQFATAVAGAVLGVNPFDQPDIEGAKTATRKLTLEYERTGRWRPRRRCARATGWRSSPTPATPPSWARPARWSTR
jgi:hypothetical protein